MLKNILEDYQLNIAFQPIISIRTKKVFALEALLRARDYKNTPISPLALFRQAKQEGISHYLDRKAHELAIREFKKHYARNPNLLLFLNIESSSIEESNDTISLFTEELKRSSIPNKNVVIEIKEDTISNTLSLQNFCDTCKDLGFNIALDDFGTGSSSFDRLAIVLPDIIKIDKSIIRDINQNYIHDEILKAIYKISEKVGALVLAEGVESDQEVLSCMHNGIDLHQGFLFAKPDRHFVNCDLIFKKITTLAETFLASKRKLKICKNNILEDAEKLTDKLLRSCTDNLHLNIQKLEERLKYENAVEAIYFVDFHSLHQVGKTIINVESRGFYQSSMDGEDHALKEYVYMTKLSNNSSYITSPYRSSASGNMCCTFSKKLTINSQDFIVCIDIHEQAFRQMSCA